jgi:thymidylate synthase (FAD)
MRVRLIAITQPIVLEIETQEELIEYAGRTCTNTTDKTGSNTEHFIGERVKQGHTSILEHVSFTFEIKEISRACLAQLTRHRIASYSVQSQRYVEQQSLILDGIMPETVFMNNEARAIFEKSMYGTDIAYNFLIKLGIPKEDARMVLPLATTTDLIMTMNLRSLQNFFTLRCAKSAQWEIRELAEIMKEIVMEYCPSAF